MGELKLSEQGVIATAQSKRPPFVRAAAMIVGSLLREQLYL
jgi:hypothetical protein